MQTRREGGVGGKLPRAPRRLGGAPSLRNIKYTVQNAPFWKEKFKNFLSRENPQKYLGEGGRGCFFGPHCGSRRVWPYVNLSGVVG